ncbi:type II toxin-antitoxin system VapC family toxin [Flavobacterium sp.]|uniref:type II toxin-antitoxin system VapC family toxin n=1 Tax=Flavobacterium sp. TaxID=239 RepID=UPI00286DB036|nr:type II toxin-antitoxin system VapC family toxin [Flavobacterium sp.]
MNGIDFLADTNFIIHLNQGNPLVESFLEYEFGVSFISEIELLGAFGISKTKKAQLSDILKDCLILDLNAQIKETCIKVRQQYKLKIPDAIIASTAIVYRIPLITSDRDFEKIKEIDLIFIEK